MSRTVLACLLSRESHVDGAMAARPSARQLLAVGECLFQDVKWIAPDKEVVELALFPSRLRLVSS
jgi:hypothetical protein